MIDPKRTRIAVAGLALSAAALVGIVQREGYTDRAVIPVKGDVPTVGFGSTRRPDGSAVQTGDRTTPPAALAQALRDITVFEGAIRQCVHVPLYQHEYDAYTSLTYNVGAKAFCGSTLVRTLNAGDYPGACAQILRWRYFQGRDCSKPGSGCAGLWSRRQAEYHQCMGD